MKKLYGYPIGLLALVLLLAACSGARTPQEAAQGFWQAVLEQDAAAAVRYSTLNDAAGFDGFAQDWSGFQFRLGRVVIEGDQATAVAELSRLQGNATQQRSVMTRLVQQEGAWLVDYVRTGEAVRGGALGSLFGQLEQLGTQLQQQVEAASKEFSAEMERMSRELEHLTEGAEQLTAQEIERYAARLQMQIDQLAESARRALEEQRQQLSPHDRQILNEVLDELRGDRQQLDNPGVESIAQGSRGVGEAQRQLEGLDSPAVDPYRKQWQAWREQFEAEMQQMLNELAAAGEGREI